MSIPALTIRDPLPSSVGRQSVPAPGIARPRRLGFPARVLRGVGRALRAALVGVLAAHWALLVLVAATLLAWTFMRPPATLLMFYRQASGRLATKPLRYVPLEKIPRTVRTMLVRLEDYTFYEHHGIDVQAIKDAARVNKIIGRRLYGGSTITQQLARTLYLTPHKSYLRKYVEAIIALAMERILGKERILELYLNYAEWGPGVYGIGAAAAYHFKKELRSLTIDEYRRLLTLLSSPLRYGAWSFAGSPLLAERYRYLTATFPSL